MVQTINNARPQPDRVLVDIADYVVDYRIESTLAYETARNCLIDTLACGVEALEYPACTKLLGPIVPGTVVPNGARVPGTGFRLDPVKAAFDIGVAIRWLDFNDCWLAAEWGHPSDNLGGILAVADFAGPEAPPGHSRERIPRPFCDLMLPQEGNRKAQFAGTADQNADEPKRNCHMLGAPTDSRGRRISVRQPARRTCSRLAASRAVLDQIAH